LKSRLNDGLILTVDRVQNETFTFRGKEIKLEQDENNPLLFTARTNLSQEEKETGTRDFAFTYNVGVASGTVAAYPLPPDDDPQLNDLTDSEKVTKVNSLAYQFKMAEPTDRGNQLDKALQNSVDTTPAQDKQQQAQNESNNAQQIKLKAIKNETEQTKKEQQQEAAKANSNSDKNNVKSGDKVQVSKQ
jgi:hypothetical protein